jgi:DeoR family fructose operon transcriptional repressor
VVADHAKIGRQALAFLCDLSEVDALIVDPGLTPAQREVIEPSNVQLIVAETKHGKLTEDEQS